MRSAGHLIDGSLIFCFPAVRINHRSGLALRCSRSAKLYLDWETMKDLGWDTENQNPFMPNLKTVKDVMKFQAAGGIGAIESRIEKAFSLRLVELKDKINWLSSVAETDVRSKNLIITSILVDARALLLEHERHKRNATLQNVYLARRLDDRAAAVDTELDREVFPGKTFRQVIKLWVDKRVVHMDWMWDEDEASAFNDMERLIFNDGMNGLFGILLRFIDDYEDVVDRFGLNVREQLDRVTAAMTGRNNE